MTNLAARTGNQYDWFSHGGIIVVDRAAPARTRRNRVARLDYVAAITVRVRHALYGRHDAGGLLSHGRPGTRRKYRARSGGQRRRVAGQSHAAHRRDESREVSIR